MKYFNVLKRKVQINRIKNDIIEAKKYKSKSFIFQEWFVLTKKITIHKLLINDILIKKQKSKKIDVFNVKKLN